MQTHYFYWLSYIVKNDCKYQKCCVGLGLGNNVNSQIKSISGIRGTLGGEEDKNLTPIDVVKYVSSYGKKLKNDSRNPKVAVGRDGRISGIQIIELVKSTLSMLVTLTIYTKQNPPKFC